MVLYIRGAIGYGYKPERAIWMAIAFVFLGWFLFWIGFHYGLMMPARSDSYIDGDTGQEHRTSENYPRSALMYSLDVFVPLVDLHQVRYWFPNVNKRVKLDISNNFGIAINGHVLWCYMWFETVAGWIIATMLGIGLRTVLKSHGVEIK